MKLSSILEKIKEDDKFKNSLLSSKKGSEFEERIMHAIINDGSYVSFPTNEFKSLKNFKQIKDKVENKQDDNVLYIKNLEDYSKTKRLVYQPFGKQKSPDFLLVNNGYIFPIELKFTEKKEVRPVWNSGLPRQNYLYIFGSYGYKDIVFFMGSNWLTFKEEQNTKKLVNNARDKLKIDGVKTIFNFEIYLRPMYNQKNNTWNNENRDYYENYSINKLKSLGF